MSNRLISETSPYLLQHAQNPVDWFPWGEDAFERARQEDKPVFLSVGYSACHWCHVMERESFENPGTAELMNRHFISVKVDREERPDVDAVYMDAVQAMTQHGGWPMSVFLTPDAVPFYGGTYFPDKPRYGMPSFDDVLQQIADLWRTRREEVLEAGAGLRRSLERQSSGGVLVPEGLDAEVLDVAMRGMTRAFDWSNGGWGGAPKFPQPALAEFLLRRYTVTREDRLLDMATRTLDGMMRGGIHDQIGGGFHRYATDDIWLVPHFEKMLYDNAQLARLYLHGWQVTGNTDYRDVVTRTLDYVAREMLDLSGGFYSAQDADSEGVEGRFFVWTTDQIREAVRAASDLTDGDADMFIQAFGVSENGNFEGANILFVAHTASEIAAESGLPVIEIETRLERVRQALFAVRERRVRPGLDDKVLAGWNGLMLAAFAEAARVLGRDDYLSIADRNAQFTVSELRTSEGRMRRTWKNGQARLNGYLEDYAFCADGLLELYQTTFDPRWFEAAHGLADSALEHFADADGGFYDTSDDHEALLIRPRGLQDGAVPSGGAIAAEVLTRLALFTGEGRYADAGRHALVRAQRTAAHAPLGFARWLAALDFALAPPQEVALVGTDVGGLLAVVRAQYRPNVIVAATSGSGGTGIALLDQREDIDGKAAAYVCRQSVCERPVTDPDELADLLP
jgi:uncharacterized protein YyaL (SSP411 family)